MKSSRQYYKDINLVRVIACVAVLLYHFNILKGGYLAVCTFFVLSGYLSCASAFKKEKFSLKAYYFNRFKKIYMPLIIVVFLTIFVVSLFPSLAWFNLKPETTSVLLNYNNFWQLSANLDYFARHVNSPFIHLWYISILLQFDLIFPFLFLALRKLGAKVHKFIPCITTFILAVIFSIYFYNSSLNQNIMMTYYGTFTRIFSILFGVFLGFSHSYYGSLVPTIFKRKNINRIIFYAYLLILISLYIFIDAKSTYFALGMIVATIITYRLIEYGTIVIKPSLSLFDKLIRSLSNISYEIYLFQYPIIFLFQEVKIDAYIKIPIMIILILLLSYILHFALDFKKEEKKLKKLRYAICTIILVGCLYGGYQYYLAEDHTAEMKELEAQLAQNEEMIQKKQEEYLSQLAKEEEDWMSTLDDLQDGESKLKEVVTNLPVIGIGDSVMLGAVNNLYKAFPNGYFDAQISRTAWVVKPLLQELENKKMLGNPIVINMGANGDCSEACKIDIMTKCEERHVFWVNTTYDKTKYVNSKLKEFATKYDNLHIIDWDSISDGHSEYFYSDGIHLTQTGRKKYTEAIYDAIYQVYLDEYNAKKEEIINKHEEELKNKISFYGNNILLNGFDRLQTNFSDAKFVINKDFNYEKLKKELEKSISEETLNHKVVLAFDKNSELNFANYQEIVELCSEHELYILVVDEKQSKELVTINGATIINFYEEIINNKGYLMADGVHLTEEGNIALSKAISHALKKEIVQ